MHKVFSYGTLKDKFNVPASKATLEANLQMSNYGPYPMLIRSSDPIPQKFEGYLLELSDSQFLETDRYEGYPELYNRKEMNVIANGQVVKAWVYIQSANKSSEKF